MAFVGAFVVAISCSDRDAPTAVAGGLTQPDHSIHGASANVTGSSLAPFTFRAPLDPFRLQQLPDFLMRSDARTDIVVQSLTFAPGAGPWHTHPGPSFVYVIEGEIKVERVLEPHVCRPSAVFTPGSAYFEVGNQVHRAVVVSDIPAVLLVTRFNIPVGAPITVPAADPGCR
jgi:quercetin dioxygenase-like cupin family protein